MKVALFQHVKIEPAGLFEQVFLEKDIPVEHIRLYESDEIPRTDATHLVFLGGPMSVNDEHEFPYLGHEKELIRQSVKNKQKVLGICLGAQLIASAYGAPVYKYVNETGWKEISRVPGADGPFSRFPEKFHVFQLHGETFEIPYGGKLLCTGPRVKNQAFRIKNSLGLQFHLELTEKIIQDWSRNLRNHAKEMVTRDTPWYLTQSNHLCRLIAEDFVKN
jgi:GMP synthase (glutamine-hydrolysing)